ncbi:hypothetical protein AOLI_G00319730 [Acnodon oligacanthus]
MMLITVFISTLLGIQGAFGEVILTQSGSKSVQLSQTVTIDCKSNSEVFRYPEGRGWPASRMKYVTASYKHSRRRTVSTSMENSENVEED